MAFQRELHADWNGQVVHSQVSQSMRLLRSFAAISNGFWMISAWSSSTLWIKFIDDLVPIYVPLFGSFLSSNQLWTVLDHLWISESVPVHRCSSSNPWIIFVFKSLLTSESQRLWDKTTTAHLCPHEVVTTLEKQNQNSHGSTWWLRQLAFAVGFLFCGSPSTGRMVMVAVLSATKPVPGGLLVSLVTEEGVILARFHQLLFVEDELFWLYQWVEMNQW